MPRKNKYDYVNLNDYEDYDFYNSGDSPDDFNPIEYQPGVYENIRPDSDFDNYLNNIGEPIPKVSGPVKTGFNWSAAGKYGLGALGVGGAIYGLYHLINYLRNRNQQSTPTASTAPNSNVVQPPVSPSGADNRFRNRFKNRNKFKRK